ncbi:hypothetical protein FKP32DRAFT_853598 [Trametes sanguinea]|nr:hypothetical protein FKP32DRAFT_853598 [Trametes sanguinea]
MRRAQIHGVRTTGELVQGGQIHRLPLFASLLGLQPSNAHWSRINCERTGSRVLARCSLFRARNILAIVRMLRKHRNFILVVLRCP